MSEAVAAGNENAGLSQVERVVDTFIAPSATFKDILRSASWWMPFLLLILSSLTTAAVVERKVGFDQVYENQVKMSQKAQDRLADMTPEQRARNAKISATATKGFSYGAFVVIMLFLALYSLLLWVSFNFGLGAKTTYAQVFAVSMYAALPYLLLSLLTIISLLAGNTEGYDYKNPVGTNLAYFVQDASPWLKGLLQSFDVVKLWSVVLQVIGMAIIAKKTIAQSAIVVGVFWFIGVIASVVGAVFS